MRETGRNTNRGRIVEREAYAPGDSEWACLLRDVNVDAVNQRYNEHEQPGDYEHHWKLCSTAQAYKALRCFLYQCSEGNIPERALYKALHQAAYAMAHEIVSHLDAYEKADW